MILFFGQSIGCIPECSCMFPNIRDVHSTNVGEAQHTTLLQLCEKQTYMATVTSLSPDNGTNVIWESTNGNDVTFKVTSDITLSGGDLCIKSSHSAHYNTDFPSDVPELHFEIVENTSGTGVVSVSETITVTMDDINSPVTVVLIVKEGGQTKKTGTYHESQGQMMRPGGS